MAMLRDEDMRAILGPDFKKIMASDLDQAKPITAAERLADRERQINKLGDMRFTLFTFVIIGIGLIFGSYYTTHGLDIAGMFGVAALVIGIGGWVVTGVRRKTLRNHPHETNAVSS